MFDSADLSDMKSYSLATFLNLGVSQAENLFIYFYFDIFISFIISDI